MAPWHKRYALEAVEPQHTHPLYVAEHYARSRAYVSTCPACRFEAEERAVVDEKTAYDRLSASARAKLEQLFANVIEDAAGGNAWDETTYARQAADIVARDVMFRAVIEGGHIEEVPS